MSLPLRSGFETLLGQIVPGELNASLRAHCYVLIWPAGMVSVTNPDHCPHANAKLPCDPPDARPFGQHSPDRSGLLGVGFLKRPAAKLDAFLPARRETSPGTVRLVR